MNDKEEQTSHIEELIQTLPEEMQKAICRLIQNIEIADRLSEGEKMTDAEIEQFTQATLERKDYILLALVKYKQYKDQRKAKNKE